MESNKAYRLIATCLLLVTLCFSANAQWYKLLPYDNPYSTDHCHYISYPIQPEVAGNGVVLYGAATGVVYNNQCLNGGGAEGVLLSKTDLNTYSGGISDGGLGPGNIATINSKNDSSHFVIYNNGGSGTYMKYTTNNFKTISTITNNTLPAWTGQVIPAGFSNSFIFYAYGLSFDSSTSNIITDTLFIGRANATLTSITTNTNTKYLTPSTIFFTSDSVGYMLSIYRNDSAKSVLARTADSGKTWSDCFLDSVRVISGCSFPSANVGYITENNGSIYKTTNAGATWLKLTSPITIPLNCVSFANDSLGYIGGNIGTLYKTINGGASWLTQTSTTARNIIALYTFGTVAYFKDANSSLYKNESPIGIENIQANGLNVDVYPNPSNNGKFAVEITNYELGITSSVEVYNMLGEKISSPSLIHTSHFVIDLSSQPNGIYMYRLVSKKGEQVATGKLVIQR